MTAETLLDTLHAVGVRLIPEGTNVRVKGEITPSQREAIRALKPSLLPLLRERETPETYQRQAILEHARRKNFPGLFYYGRYLGAGERIWKRFCLAAHPGWLALAQQALSEYVPDADGATSA
jgi:hypothetical protein